MTNPPPKVRYDKRFNGQQVLNDYERFQSYIVKSKFKDGCWEFSGLRNEFGYGLLTLDHKTWYTHRLAWVWEYGAIPSKTNVCHKCDNTSCVRPDHLFLGSPKQNTHDMIQKRRSNFFPGVQWKGEFNQKAVLTAQKVIEITEKYASGKCSMKQLSKEYGVERSAIGSIIHHRSWRHVRRLRISKEEIKRIGKLHVQVKKGEDAGNAKLTPEKVLLIRADYDTGQWTQKMLAAKYGIGKSQVGNVVSRRSWEHI